MKNAVLPHYEGDLKGCVFGMNTKKGSLYLTKIDVEGLQKAIEKTLKLFKRYHLDREVFLFPVYRNFYQSGEFGNVAGEVSDRVKAAFPALSDLQTLLKKSVKMASFTKKGRTPKEGGSDFAYHIVHHFFMAFNRLPSSTTRNSHLEQIAEICYRTVGIKATDLHKTVSKAIERYKRDLSHQS
jgi:hypothetical protein